VARGKIEKHSPIIDAIREAEAGTEGEIRVHLSQRWFEKDPWKRAENLFAHYGLGSGLQQNTILIYINLRKRSFAILGDLAIHQRVGQTYWNNLARELTENLRSTQSEKAIALTIRSIGKILKTHVPRANSDLE
jgi:uncharacterized membrane protein